MQKLISIHAPRGGSDPFIQARIASSSIISIHAPRGGSDGSSGGGIFLRRNFNPRSPWGERLAIGNRGNLHFGISIHAPRGGSDAFRMRLKQSGSLFQSTLPVGGATSIPSVITLVSPHFNPRSPWGERLPFVLNSQFIFYISIHAPRGGSDPGRQSLSHPGRNFNPRSPWGERPRTICFAFRFL